MSPIILLPVDTPSYDQIILADSPYAYYKLDEIAGPTAADSSGNVRDGIYTGPVTLGAPGLVNDGGLSMDVTPQANPNMEGVVYPPGFTWPDFGDFTVEAWFNYDVGAPAASLTVVEHYPNGGPGGFLVTIDNSGPGPTFQRMKFDVKKTGFTGDWRTTGNTVLLPNTTYYVACRVSYPNADVFINGVPDTPYVQNDVIGDKTYKAASFHIGYTEWSGGSQIIPFDGRIDNVAFYTSALSNARILAHYQAGI